MVISLNSSITISCLVPGKYQLAERPGRASKFAFSSARGGKGLRFALFVTNNDQVAADTNYSGSGKDKDLVHDDQLAVSSSTSSNIEDVSQTQTNESFNGSNVSPERDAIPSPKKLTRSPLTARDKLRAARVLSRYTEPQASKAVLGNKVLEVLRAGERGKMRSGLPEAPGNLFDDSKRGVPKRGLVFEFPGGIDVFFVVISVVLISTVMFTTTYIVWKVGAIHFNEY